MDIKEFYSPKMTYAIGGGTFLGFGVGFFYLITSILVFIGCLLTGFGLGLILASFFSISNKDN